jgi:uncharacterized membrane protein YhaH (DUF805 family)
MEFWMFVLFNTVIALLVSIVAGLLHATWLSPLYSLAVLLPSLALWVRRLHDRNMSGWWVLIALTGIGAVVLLILACLDGTRGENRFGPDPHDFVTAVPA